MDPDGTLDGRTFDAWTDIVDPVYVWLGRTLTVEQSSVPRDQVDRMPLTVVESYTLTVTCGV